jgi:hypothetical protein
MTAGEPLQGPDISQRLRSPRGFGVTAARAPDDVPTIELVTDPTVHGPSAQINICRAGPDDGLTASFGACARGDSPPLQASLVAWLQVGDRGWLQCASQDSIRFWGKFSPAAELVVESSIPIRLVARTPAGDVLAGPVTLAHESPITLTWPGQDATAS